ncbi:hypothetical protein CK203_066483 [Vitis vinifera]|uniref:Retrovirus-related Pol polyprotein from transposon TNT 1-94 n=1 Tax=Vitis vinifera TaxID=29760 RepID=A0A438I3W3_VITVI|nr:hypothetical protein CK203_066483 [Vitis vinifera]
MLMGMVRSMMSFSSLLISCWGNALDIVTYLLNLAPSKSVDKLEARSEVCQFVGYPKDWKTLKDTFTLAQETMGLEVSTPTILVTSCTLVPHYSRRVVIQPYRAIEAELESMCFNEVWDLVETLEGIKPIGCKWVYKRKRRVDGKCPKTIDEKDRMKEMPYASTVGSLMYAMLCTRPDICFAVGDELLPLGYMALDFQFDRDYCKFTFGFVFTLSGGAVSWRSVK